MIQCVDIPDNSVEHFEAKDWYDNIEPGVREVVRLLRNNGYNTIMSCEHTMTVSCEFYIDDYKKLSDLYDLLQNNGYSEFEIHVQLSSKSRHFPDTWLQVTFPKTENTGPHIMDYGVVVSKEDFDAALNIEAVDNDSIAQDRLPVSCHADGGVF